MARTAARKTAPKRGKLVLVKNSSIGALSKRHNVVYVGISKDMKNLKARLYSHERTKGIKKGKMHYAVTSNMYRAENTLMDKIEGQSRKKPLKNKRDSGAPAKKGYLYAVTSH